MKKFNYLLLTLSLITGSLHSAATSDAPVPAGHSESPSKQELERQIHESNLMLLFLQESLLENEVIYLQSLKKETSDTTMLKNITSIIRTYNTKRLDLQNQIKKYSRLPFFNDIQTCADLTVQECYEAENSSYQSIKNAIEKDIEETINNLLEKRAQLATLLTPLKSTGLGMAPRKKFAGINPVRRGQRKKGLTTKNRIEALKQDARED
ncbi:hypothetical protein K2W90_03230 [Candidatus Babeliales bacterium]|nr:hypothetical protein [Candidatus Babeliales bacterium]